MRDRVDWSRVEIFWGDERTVSPDDDESNYGMAYRALLKPVGVPLAHIHRMAGDAPDLQGAARAYEAKIRRVVPITARGFPRFDAILLGMGTDGHTASLFPDAVGWRRSRRWVRVVMGPRPDTLRLTLTLPVLNAAARVLFQVAGAAKAAALGRFADPETRPPVPAQMVTVPDGVRVVLADVAAAARLPAGASGGAADRLDAAWRAYVARSHAR
jgi:6-phosphogluconolactonase